MVLGTATVALPEAETLPPPGDRVTDVAPEVLHVKSDMPPPLRLEGLAENELMTGGIAADETVTVAVPVTLPAALAAVKVYVVVTDGVAMRLPDDGT